MSKMKRASVLASEMEVGGTFIWKGDVYKVISQDPDNIRVRRLASYWTHEGMWKEAGFTQEENFNLYSYVMPCTINIAGPLVQVQHKMV